MANVSFVRNGIIVSNGRQMDSIASVRSRILAAILLGLNSSHTIDIPLCVSVGASAPVEHSISNA